VTGDRWHALYLNTAADDSLDVDTDIIPATPVDAYLESSGPGEGRSRPIHCLAMSDTDRPVEEAEQAPGDNPIDSFTEKLDAFHTLRSRDPDAADDFLASLGGEFSRAEEAIVAEMASTTVLAEPARFVGANRRVVKAIEVLYRNGHRPAPIKGWWFLKPVAQALQVFVTAFITRSHANAVLQNVLELYTSRENQATRGSDDYKQLIFARWNLDKMNQRYRADSFSIPTFLIGGVTFATVATWITELLTAIVGSKVLLIGFVLIMLGLIAAIGSGIVQSAGIAKRRIALTTEPPLQTLYEVVGSAGVPPRDHAWAFALGAIGVLIVVWLLMPGVVIGLLVA
jgi:hypothetical protein